VSSSDVQPLRLCILGLGLLGASVALAAKHRGLARHISGWSNRASTRDAAMAGHIVDAVHDSPADAVRDADLIVLATTVSTIPTVAASIASAVASRAIVTDVGSTKRLIVEQCASALGSRFIGSHPMAGGEKTGLDHARADLFDRATCIVTPTPANAPADVELLERFWSGLGLTTVRLDPSEHDRLVALVSHLPHAVAGGLVAVQTDLSMKLAGPGFRDSTRIAASDPALWRDIFLDNADASIASADMLIDWLEGFRAALVSRDGPQIERLLREPSDRRKSL
jgi:prephenate dehydrogenase